MLAPIAFSSPVEAQTAPDIEWTGSGASGGTQDIQVKPVGDEPIEFGPASGRSLRIQAVGTGDQVTLTPNGNETYQVTEFEVNFGDLRGDDPVMNGLIAQDGEVVFDYPVEIEGDVDAFYAETFGEYSVQLLDSNGSVIAETDETKLRAAGYEHSFEYNGSVLAVDRDPGVQPGWHVELTQAINGSTEEITTVENDADSDFFMIETADTGFDPDGGTIRVNIYPDATQTSLEDRIITLFASGGLSDDQIVDGPVGTDNESTVSDREVSDGDGGSTASQTANRTVVDVAEPGESLTVTVSGTLSGDAQTLTITESFAPEFVDVSVDSYSLDGQEVSLAEPTISEFNTDGVDFVHDGDGQAIANSSYELVYTVDVGENVGTEYELSDGSVSVTDLEGESTSTDLEPANITVAEPVQLALSVNETSVNASETISFTVTNSETGEAIENATVTFLDSDITVLTDADGTASFTFQGAGDIQAVARKSPTDSRTFADSDSVNVSVGPDPADEVSKYRDPGTGGVEVDGLRRGIDDFTRGDADIELLRQLIDEFTSG